MRSILVIGLTALLFCAWGGESALSQSRSASVRIEWQVKNRFRLFRNEADFQRHVAADRGDGVLAAEDRLESKGDGRGWARDMVDHLCIDAAGKLPETCERDGERENYLTPKDHR